MSVAAASISLSYSGAFPAFWAELQRLAENGNAVTLSGLDALEPAQAALILNFFLHDPAVVHPIEPFSTLLDAMVNRRETGLWDVFPGGPRDEVLRALPWEQPGCMACACFPACQGYGAWKGRCETWRAVLAGIAAAARELQRLRPGTRSSHQRGSHDHS